LQDLITYERRGQIALIGLNRPAKRNAFTVEMLRDLASAYGQYGRDASARCLVVHATGSDFCSGLDLSQSADSLMVDGPKLFLTEGAIDPTGVATPRVPKPVISAIGGYCFTLGIELALAGDVVVASSSARFGQLEVTRGIYAFCGATVRMPLAFGWGNAMRWLLTGDQFDAAEAHRIGLVQEVVEPGSELTRALEIAERIAAAAPLAVAATLRSARRSVEHGAEAALRDLYPDAVALHATADAQLGIATYLDRKRPAFAGS
jgi:enoyl-CoA hydratase